MSILIIIIMLAILIVVHEFGHLIAAKYAGIGVIEFSIGMGPKLFSKEFKNTIYSLRLLPIGGYVKLAGLDDENVSDDINYRKKSIFHRFLTISGGSFMNFILGILILFSLSYVLSGVIKLDIQSVIPGSPAEKFGLLRGDKIVSVNSQPLKYFDYHIKQSANKEVFISLIRNNQNMTVRVVPEKNTETNMGFIGVKLNSDFHKFQFFDSIKTTIHSFNFQIKSTFTFFKLLIQKKMSVNEMSGPIGIIQFSKFGLDQNEIKLITKIKFLLEIMGIISISLGIINLLPFPVLDGGHLLFLVIEFLRNKPLSKNIENSIMTAGVVCLIMLTCFITFNDIKNWDNRAQKYQESSNR
ncbi:RIP metalloprotease RseP [Candidatus Marinamargulisbacteria bacterium SCGC AG-410-N11]|nr:RIP metalloprotease RseP [Candidatus Marinamargulisbacteria bacterium SCGC AG-410-N11]